MASHCTTWAVLRNKKQHYAQVNHMKIVQSRNSMSSETGRARVTISPAEKLKTLTTTWSHIALVAHQALVTCIIWLQSSAFTSFVILNSWFGDLVRTNWDVFLHDHTPIYNASKGDLFKIFDAIQRHFLHCPSFFQSSHGYLYDLNKYSKTSIIWTRLIRNFG